MYFFAILPGESSSQKVVGEDDYALKTVIQAITWENM